MDGWKVELGTSLYQREHRNNPVVTYPAPTHLSRFGFLLGTFIAYVGSLLAVHVFLLLLVLEFDPTSVEPTLCALATLVNTKIKKNKKSLY